MFDELGAMLGVDVLAPTLPSDPRLDETVSALQRIGPLPVLGYSMGGRVALRLALEHAELVSELYLVSTSPGISDPVQRESRRLIDGELAGHIGEAGIEAFVDEWLAMPMFQGLLNRGPEWCAVDRAMRLQNTAGHLVRCLEELGQGAMPYVGDRLRGLTMPVAVIVGQRDDKYRPIGKEMVAAIPHGRLNVIAGVGHNAVGEAPQAVVEIIRSFIQRTG